MWYMGISRDNQFGSKPLYELSHIYKQNAKKQMHLPWEFTVAITLELMTPKYKEAIQPTPLVTTLQVLMIKENLNINNAWSIT